MIIAKPGNYRTVKPITTRNAASIGTIPGGTVLKITSVDYEAHKVIGPELFDWIHWDLPVESI
jgi:hypothetical protein